VEGGLGIKQLDSFIKAVLGKWKWTLGSFEHGLWKDILVSKYGSWRNLSDPTTLRHASRWWCDLNKACEDGQGINWFDSNTDWAVGSGEKIKLREDVWVDNSQLKV